MQLGRFKTKALYWISSHTLKCPCFQSVLVRFKHKTVKKHTAWRYVIYTESPDRYCMGIVKRVVWYVNSNCSHNVFSHSFNGFIFTYNRDSWVSLHNLRYIYSVYRWMQLYRIVNSGLSFSYLVFKGVGLSFSLLGCCMMLWHDKCVFEYID